jgi:TldD protein
MDRSLMESRLGKAFGLSTGQLDKVMADALTPSAIRAGVWSEVYLQKARAKTLVLSEGIIKKGESEKVNGGGVRTIDRNGVVGYSYTDNIGVRNLRSAARISREILNDGRVIQPVAVLDPISLDPHDLYSGSIDQSASLEKRCKLLRDVEQAALSFDSRIIKVNVSLALSEEVIGIVNSNGVLVVDECPMLRLNVQCIAQDGKRIEQGTSGGGGRIGFDVFVAQGRANQFARDAAAQAIRLLKAEDAPGGVMPVALGNGWTGILVHEAVGHGLEGDFNRLETSAFSGRVGQLVAAPCVTIIDDGTMRDRRGSLNVDGEGTPTQKNVLIRDGVLQGYMQDTLNAGLMGVRPTGNGRRESYQHAPMPRMTTTYMAAGDASPEDVIASIDYGLYAPSFSSGQVDITSGDFVFVASEAWVVEKGKRTRYVKGATIAGNGPKAMTQVKMVANDLAFDPGIGSCGKGQWVPVGVGMPTARIDGLTVGGKEKQS